MIFPTFLLTLGFVDDLLTRKVHNILSGILLIGAFTYSLYHSHLGAGALGLATAFLLLFPMFALRILGAGDVKLMMAFGLATSPAIVLEVALLGLIWAAVFGLTKIFVSGNWSSLSRMVLIVKFPGIFRPSPIVSLPMTFPLLLGWLSYLHLEGMGL